MNFRVLLSAVVSVVIGTSGGSGFISTSLAGEQGKQPDLMHQLWNTQLAPRLQRNVQNPLDAYYDGEYLMVPLHVAFRHGDAEWEQSFSDHFARLVANPSLLPTVVLDRVQYLYLASEFIVLAKESGREALIPPRLPDLLFSQVQALWRSYPAWQWERQPFAGGMKERLLWKLNNRQVPRSYFRAVLDDDYFVFAIASDLKAYGRTPAQQHAWDSTLDDVLAHVYRTFTQEVVPEPGGGWLIQPGVWTDHPEFKYAGNREARPGIRPAPVPRVAQDSSHSARYPLWITSYMRAYPVNSERYRYFLGLREGLEKQFYSKVLVKPTKDVPCYRLNNYMDGQNGVYRWGYENIGAENGYGPYGLSGTLLIGWWVFLDSDRVRVVYRDLAAQFPWRKQCLDFYLGPTPTHTHPASDYDPESAGMHVWHALVLVASEF